MFLAFFPISFPPSSSHGFPPRVLPKKKLPALTYNPNSLLIWGFPMMNKLPTALCGMVLGTWALGFSREQIPPARTLCCPEHILLLFSFPFKEK